MLGRPARAWKAARRLNRIAGDYGGFAGDGKAKAVLIGRPPLWGLAAGGADGVQHVVELLASEFDNALALLGVTGAQELDRSLLH